MEDSGSPNLPRPAGFDWGSLLQFVLSLLVAVQQFGLAGLVLVYGVWGLGIINSGPEDRLMVSFLAASAALIGALVLPSAWYAWKRLTGGAVAERAERRWEFAALTLLVLAALPLILWGGEQALKQSQIAWAILPGLNLLAVGLPVLWFVRLSLGGLRGTSPQRAWGLFVSGMALATPLVMILEMMAIGLAVAAVGVWMAGQPGQMEELAFLARRLRFAGSEQALLRIVTPYLERPGIWVFGLICSAVLVPIIEETVKPIGLWLLALRRQPLTPGDGFAAGALGGAGFALAENLIATGIPGNSWALMAASRLATAGVHIFLSGLVGYGLVCAWRQGQFLRLGVAYALSITVHGLWNGLMVFWAARLAASAGISAPPPLPQWGETALISQGVLAACCLILLIGFNRSLRRQISAQGAIAS